jgi:hypothetical protein
MAEAPSYCTVILQKHVYINPYRAAFRGLFGHLVESGD